MNIRLKALVSIFAISLLYMLYYFVIPYFINPNIVEPMLEKEFGYDFEIKNPSIKMGLTPSLWLKADDFKIVNKNKTEALKIVKPNLEIQLFPLIIKRTHLKNFYAKDISVNLGLDKEQKWYVGDYILVMNSDSKLSLNNAKIRVDNFNVKLTDKALNKQIKIKGDYFDLLKYNPKKGLKLSTSAKVIFNNRVSNINLDTDIKLPLRKSLNKDLQIDGSLTNFYLEDFSVYVNALTKKKVKNTTGVINFDVKTTNAENGNKYINSNITLDRLGIYMNSMPASIVFDEKLKGASSFVVKNNKIRINQCKIEGPNLNYFTSGTITKIDTKKPVLDLFVKIDKSRAEQFIKLLPGIENLVPDINLYKLKKYGFFGDLIGSLNISGPYDMPLINGKFIASNAYVIEPIKNSPKAIIKLAFLGKKMSLNVHVPTSYTDVVDVKGNIDLYGEKQSSLLITSTNNVNLATVQKVLVPIHEVFQFDLGPVPIMDIKGLGNINLRTSGTKQNPRLNGQFNFKNGTVSFNDIHNMALNNASGYLKFKEADTHFVSQSAFFNGKPVTVDGHCSLYGILDFDVTIKGQDLGTLINVVKTSPMLSDIGKLIQPLNKGSGEVDLIFNLKGKVKNIDEMVFGKNVTAKGTINLKKDSLLIDKLDTPIDNISGLVKFDNLNTNLKLKANIKNSPLSMQGSIKNNNADLKFKSEQLDMSDVLSVLPQKLENKFNTDLFKHILLRVSASYKGNISKIDFEGIEFKSVVLPNSANSLLKVYQGAGEMKNSGIKIFNTKGTFKNSPFTFNANIQKFGQIHQNINADLDFKTFDIAAFNNLKEILPQRYASKFRKFSNFSGKAEIKGSIRNNHVNGFAKLNSVKFSLGNNNIPVKILSGNLSVQNSTLSIKKINSILGNMPMFINGSVTNIYKKPQLNIYINGKPNQNFVDKYYNSRVIYPIKIKGDIATSTKLGGTLNEINVNSDINFSKEAKFTYMGASLGDSENPIKLHLNAIVKPREIHLNNLDYSKVLTSQSERKYLSPQLRASGTIAQLGNDFVFKNFKIKTSNPTDARIFNIIFRKPMIKQGQFTSDIEINETSQAPKIHGKLHLTGMDIPFFDASFRDISLDFKPRTITLIAKGEVIGNAISMVADVENKLTPPYEVKKADVNVVNLDLNKIANYIRDYEVESTKLKSSSATSKQNIDASSIIVKNAKVNANKVRVRNIVAENFSANLSVTDKLLFAIDNYKFDVAQGHIKGSYKFNMLNNFTSLDMSARNVNANTISEALFYLSNQIYGDLTGEISLRCNGTSSKSCMETLTGHGGFEVKNGKMPKLGSLEYLLKAGNLVKSGFTGLSLNSLVDLVTPLKTGNFETIKGSFFIDKGTTENLQIFTKGKDLSLFITGRYNFANYVADMSVFGRLSKKISTAVGPMGNASLNTLFNLIPGLNLDNVNKGDLLRDINKIPIFELDTKPFRIFTVDIFGDITGDNYVKSFKWVE